MSAILRELVSHASRIEWCNMRRYSAFAACLCDVYVCVCVCVYVCVYVNVVACSEILLDRADRVFCINKNNYYYYNS